MRFAHAAGMVFIGWALFLAPPAPAADAGELVQEILSGDPSRQREGQIVTALAQEGDPAVRAILAAWADPDLPVDEAGPLIEALGRIDSAAAVRALRSILASALFLPSDLPDLPALLRALYVPDPDKAAPTPALRVWRRLTPGVQRMIVGQIEALEKAGADAPDVPRVVAVRLASALNEVLDDPQFFAAQAFGDVQLDAEARSLLARRVPDATEIGVGLNPFEQRRLNRLLLRAAFPGAILPGPPLFMQHYNARVAREAVAAVAANPHPDALEMLMTFRPIGIPNQKAFLMALAEVDDPRVVWALEKYLLSPDRGLGGLALRAFQKRRESSGAEDVVEGAYRRLARGGLEVFPEATVDRVLRAAAALDDRGEAAAILADALDEEEFRDAALGVVSRSAVLLAERDVLGEVLDAVARRSPSDQEPLEDELSEAQLLALLEGVERYKVRAALPVVALCLESRYADVRMQACDLMGALTEEDFGRNPVAWLKWYREERR